MRLISGKAHPSDYVDQMNMGSHIELSYDVSDSHLNIEDGLHNSEANLNQLYANKDLMQIRS